VRGTQRRRSEHGWHRQKAEHRLLDLVQREQTKLIARRSKAAAGDPMHNLYAQQLAEATGAGGEVDLGLLGRLVTAAYDEAERDRRTNERSIAMMIDELAQLNRSLEELVDERTAELRAREAELAAQNFRFDATINNMSQGLLMFSPDHHLVICNQRYREMYGLSPDIVKPGCTLRGLLEHRVETGTFSDDIDAYIAELLDTIARGKTATKLVELSDGRTIAVLNHPMAGGGWVATHEDITERRRAERQIAHMARHDALTDLPNRVLLSERLSEALAGPHRNGMLAVLYLDLDHFKGINDTLGHAVGDELLKAIAERLLSCVNEHDTVARIGGDEFAIIQTNIESPSEAAMLARLICDVVKEPYRLHGHVLIVDTSIGIAIAPNDSSSVDELLKNADMALYRAKADGRGTYRFFEAEMDARVKARRSMELALRRALDAGEFELHYQPILDLARNTVSCCEALLRWRHPELGVVPPAEFIPVAEEIGLIVPLGEWVLRQACNDAAHWPEDVRVAVNLSPIQLINQNLLPVVVNALAFSQVSARRLELEITEAVLMQNTEATIATLHRLRDFGVRISMDDFGTGYSSLSYLRSFPFDKIKIDRCFISGLPDASDSQAIVRAVVGLAGSLKMRTTAEGVETEQQLEQVRALGCTEIQGYVFSPPCTAADIARLLRPAAPLALSA
jgi:diguanylate cyclase (GGDEF)-like protein